MIIKNKPSSNNDLKHTFLKYKTRINAFKNKIKKTFLVIFTISIIILTINFAYSIKFNEIMPNPIGNDLDREWIELSNPYCEDISKIKLFENNINHNIVLYRNGSCEYPIICNNCAKIISELNISSQLYESSFTLNNNGEYLALKYNEIILDWINYSVVPEGYSLTKYDEWVITQPTPGYHINNISTNNTTLNNTQNEIQNDETSCNELNHTHNIYNNTYTNNTYIENTIENNIIKTNQTTNYTNYDTNLDSNICNITIGIKLKEEKQIFENKESIKFYNTLNITPQHKSNFSIEYWIEDIYGKILKNKIQTNNLNEKTFTPNIKEKLSVIIIKNNLIDVECNCSKNIINNSSEKILIIKNSYYSDNNLDKKCEVNDSSNNKLTNNKSVEQSFINTEIDEKNIIIKVYRGNDRKYAINFQIKNNQNKKITEIKVYLEKNSFAELFFPLKNLECGNYTITTEGLGYKKIDYYNEPCKNSEPIIKENIISKQSSTNNEINITKNNTEITTKFYNTPAVTGKTIYISRNEQTKKYSLIGIIILSSSTIIYFLYKYFFKNTNKTVLK